MFSELCSPRLAILYLGSDGRRVQLLLGYLTIVHRVLALLLVIVESGSLRMFRIAKPLTFSSKVCSKTMVSIVP